MSSVQTGILKSVTKSSKGGVSDVDTVTGTVKLAHTTYKTRDRDRDLSNKGMFTKSWKEFKDTRFFFNHKKEETPGTIKGFEEDDDHGYTIVKMGDWTLGTDVLKMMQAGAVKDVSYQADITKWKDLSDGGHSFLEGWHRETSVLTHWGSHPESKVKAIKEAKNMEVLKQLTEPEAGFMRELASIGNSNLVKLTTFAASLDESSDLYTWVNDYISDVSRSLSYMKSRLYWGLKELGEGGLAEIQERITTLKSFCKDTDASDECIKNILKEVTGMESIIKAYESKETTVAANKALQQDLAGNEDFETEIQILLLNQNLLMS